MDKSFLLTLALAGVIIGVAVVNAVMVFRRESRRMRGQLPARPDRRRLVS